MVSQEHGIQTPPHIIVNRDENNNVVGEEFIEGEDYVQVRTTLIRNTRSLATRYVSI